MSQYKFKINGNEYNVAVNAIEGKNAFVNVNGIDYTVELENEVAPAAVVSAPIASPAPVVSSPAAAPKPSAGAGKVITSPLPGVIISVDVREGAAVKRGQKLAVIEAMKMENEILSDVDGTVVAIHVNKGDSVLEDAKIVTIG